MPRGGSGNISLYVNRIADDTRPDDLKHIFSDFGPVRDVYIPLDYYTRRPRGFAYVEFEEERDAAIAVKEMNGYRWHGRDLVVEYAEGNRKTPIEMRGFSRSSSYGSDRYGGGSDRYGGRDSYGGSSRRRRSRSRSRSRSADRDYHRSSRSRRSRSRSRSPERSHRRRRSSSRDSDDRATRRSKERRVYSDTRAPDQDYPRKRSDSDQHQFREQRDESAMIRCED